SARNKDTGLQANGVPGGELLGWNVPQRQGNRRALFRVDVRPALHSGPARRAWRRAVRGSNDLRDRPRDKAALVLVLEQRWERDDRTATLCRRQYRFPDAVRHGEGTDRDEGGVETGLRGFLPDDAE